MSKTHSFLEQYIFEKGPVSSPNPRKHIFLRARQLAMPSTIMRNPYLNMYEHGVSPTGVMFKNNEVECDTKVMKNYVCFQPQLH